MNEQYLEGYKAAIEKLQHIIDDSQDQIKEELGRLNKEISKSNYGNMNNSLKKIDDWQTMVLGVSKAKSLLFNEWLRLKEESRTN